MRYLLLLLIHFSPFFIASGIAQKINGSIIDSQTGEPLSNANVKILNTNLGVTTDDNGYFDIHLPEHKIYEIRASMIGYQSIVKSINIDSDSGYTLNFYLSKHTVQLNPEIVVTARRTKSDQFETPEAITVINHRWLKQDSPRTVPEALSGSVGVFIQKTNHGGGAPIIRGLMGNQNLLLIDGIRLNNSTFRYGPNQYLNTIDPFLIDKIEVVRGAGSVLYGSDAIGGVVQVFSHEPSFSDTAFWVQGNVVGKWISHNMEKTTRAGLTLSDKRVAFSGGFTYSDFGDIVAGSGVGKESPTGYTSYATDTKLKLKLHNKHTLTFAFQYNRQNDVPRYDRMLAGYQRYHFDPQIRMLGYTRLNSDFKSRYLQNLTLTVFFGQSHEKRILQRTGQDLIVNELDIADSYGAIAEFKSNPVLNWTITSGIEYYHDIIRSSKTEIHEMQRIEKRGYYPDGATSSNFAIFSSHSVNISRFNFMIGGRYNTFRIRASDPDFENIQLNPDAFVANASLVYNLHPNHKIITSAYSAFRSPNINDLSSFGFFNFGIEVPNPSLVPEKSFTTEIGIKSRYHHLSGSVFAFNNRLTNLIERIPASWNGLDSINGEKVFKKTNFAKANIKGVEAELAYAPHKSLSFSFNLTYNYGLNITLDEPMTRIPPLFGRFGFYYANPNGLWSKLEWHGASLQDRLSASDIRDTRIPDGGTPGWNILNYRIGYTWKWISINAGIHNIFNKAYRTHGSGVHGYGRHAQVSINIAFP